MHRPALGLSNVFCGLLPWGYTGQSTKLTTHIYPEPRWGMYGVLLPLICVFMIFVNMGALPLPFLVYSFISKVETCLRFDLIFWPQRCLRNWLFWDKMLDSHSEHWDFNPGSSLCVDWNFYPRLKRKSLEMWKIWDTS